MFLGDDLAAWMVLALGAAMAAGHFVALVHPPTNRSTGGDQGSDLSRAPVGRSIVFIGLGLVAAIWALASLVS